MATSIFHRNFPQVQELEEKCQQARYIIGLDVHKKTTAICVIDSDHADQPVYQQKRVKNNQLLEKIQSFPGKKLVVSEASYGWFPLREALESLEDVTFIIFDARKTSAWIESSGIKNDKIDAQVLAFATLHGGISRLTVNQPCREEKEHFKLVNFRDQLVCQRTSVKNQLKALDRDYGINPYTGEQIEKSQIVKDMEDCLLDQLRFLNEKIQSVEKTMDNLSRDDETISLLKTIPGIGSITAFALRWKIGTIDRFASSAHLSSYFGFGLRQQQSGEHFVKGKITKTGNPLIRKLLVQGAQVIRFQRQDLVELYFPKLGQEKAMKDFRHANKVVIALARKNLTFAYQILKTSQAFDLNIYRQKRAVSVNIPVVSSIPQQPSVETEGAGSKAAELV